MVQSQVLPYLRELVGNGFSFQLITFERKGVQRKGLNKNIESDIEWTPVSQARGFAGVVVALLKAWTLARQSIKQDQVELVHARSYLPAMIAALSCYGRALPWLFDMRGFWVDEKVLKGSLRFNSVKFRFLKKIERFLLRDCTAIVSLTNKALPRLKEISELDVLPVHAVIPTCVDVHHFTQEVTKSKVNDELVFGYIGSLGPGYSSDDLSLFLEYVLEALPHSRALILSRSDITILQPVLDRLARFGGRVQCTDATYDEMPQKISTMDVGLSFITPDHSKDASAPTKIAEYLACGVYVVSNRDIGDVDELLGQGDVGVSVESPVKMNSSFINQLTAKVDSVTRDRCRAFAEQHFSVEHGAAKYAEIYKRIIIKKAAV